MFPYLIGFFFFINLIGCAGTPPIFEYNKAEMAKDTGQEKPNAFQYSQKRWEAGERFFDGGEAFYKRATI